MHGTGELGFATYRWMSAPARLEIAREAITLRPGRLLRWFGRAPSITHTSRKVTGIASRTMYSSSSFMLVLRENSLSCLSGVVVSDQRQIRALLQANGYELTVLTAPGWLWWFFPFRIIIAKARGWL